MVDKDTQFESLENGAWIGEGNQNSFPEKFALGNLVRLNEPYRQFDHGIIVEHIGYVKKVPRVSLHLWNQQGELHISSNPPIPHYVDFSATQFEVVRVAKTR